MYHYWSLLINWSCPLLIKFTSSRTIRDLWSHLPTYFAGSLHVGFTGSSLHEDSHTPSAAELIALAKVNLHKIESQLRRTDGLRVKKTVEFSLRFAFWSFCTGFTWKLGVFFTNNARRRRLLQTQKGLWPKVQCCHVSGLIYIKHHGTTASRHGRLASVHAKWEGWEVKIETYQSSWTPKPRKFIVVIYQSVRENFRDFSWGKQNNYWLDHAVTLVLDGLDT